MLLKWPNLRNLKFVYTWTDFMKMKKKIFTESEGSEFADRNRVDSQNGEDDWHKFTVSDEGAKLEQAYYR